MLFNSLEFVFVFLPITLVGFYLLADKMHYAAIVWLVIASLFFYSYWNPGYLPILVISILFNYFIGSILRKSKNRKLLTFGICCNLAALAYYKYTDFFIFNINTLMELDFNFQNIVLPLAISFFTFQQIAYLIDTYRKEVNETSFLHYCLFITFFPQLIAGPIVHHKEMLPQFSGVQTYRFNNNYFSPGVAIFTIGLAKKVLIADMIAGPANTIFKSVEEGYALTMVDAWTGTLAYTFQIYFDFSAYGDMAIGLALMFGIKLPINFNSPYKAVNIIEFWRSWHMTLSRFLRDYLYFPLGGNRQGPSRRHINLMLTMLIGGVWHGASWNFIIWGVLHGLFLVINHSWQSIRQNILGHNLKESRLAGRIASVFLTFTATSIAWVFFRAETLEGARVMIYCLIGLAPESLPILTVPSSHMSAIVWLPILFIPVFFMPNTLELVHKLDSKTYNHKSNSVELIEEKLTNWNGKLALAVYCGILLFLSVKVLMVFPETEFLYFNF